MRILLGLLLLVTSRFFRPVVIWADGVGEALLLLLVCAGPDVLVQLAL